MLRDSLPATVSDDVRPWKGKQWKKANTAPVVLPKACTEVYCEVKVTYGKAWTGEILVGFLVGGAKLELKPQGFQVPSVKVSRITPIFFRSALKLTAYRPYRQLRSTDLVIPL